MWIASLIFLLVLFCFVRIRYEEPRLCPSLCYGMWYVYVCAASDGVVEIHSHYHSFVFINYSAHFFDITYCHTVFLFNLACVRPPRIILLMKTLGRNVQNYQIHIADDQEIFTS